MPRQKSEPGKGSRTLAPPVPAAAVALVVLLLGHDAAHVDGALRDVERVLVVEVVPQVAESADLPTFTSVQFVGVVDLQDLAQVGDNILE